MYNDPIVEQVRKIRIEIEDQCKKEGKTYYQYLLEQQKKNKSALVRRKTKIKKNNKAA